MTNYRELLKAYQNGTLDEVQREAVRQDIEKQDAIGDYLFEQSDLPPLDALESEPDSETCSAEAETARFTAAVQKSVRRVLLRLGAAVGAVVLAVTFLVIFALPHVLDQFYYDPTETVSYGPETNTIQLERVRLDLAVWSELFQPGDLRSQAYAEPMGYGKYALTFPGAHRSGGGTSRAVSGMLVRDRIQLYDPNVMNVFLNSPHFVRPVDSNPEEDREIAAHLAQDLEEDLWYRVDVSLAEITDYQTLYQWCADRGLTGKDAWFQVYRELPEGVSDWVGLGFSEQGSPLYTEGAEIPGYPELLLDFGWHFDAEQVQQHYLSLLAYTKDHPEFSQAMGQGGDAFFKALDAIAAYVEENGLQLSGMSFIGKKADILPLLEDPMVSFISTSELE